MDKERAATWGGGSAELLLGFWRGEQKGGRRHIYIMAH
jgi:hypothetical protein